jgi:addiction module HigA family antidote
MNKRENQYEPDVVSIPGATLQDVLDERSMSQAELATRLGRPKKTISEIITGKAAITADTALQLERVLDIPASFWLSREQQYREFLARRRAQEDLERDADWLSGFPVAELIRKGWIREVKDVAERVREMLRFFGVASSEQWRAVYERPQASFRKAAAFKSSQGALSAWLRRGEIMASKIACAPYDEERFRAMLGHIRVFTRESPSRAYGLARELCAQAGVALVVVEEVQGSRVNGVTRWISPTKALIQLSGRHKSDDVFWFTFFHEAGHILRHGKREVFLEVDTDDDPIECEADDFAREHLIPSVMFEALCEKYFEWSESSIVDEAAKLQVAPGILLGRLQKCTRVPWKTRLNSLKQKIEPGELARI